MSIEGGLIQQSLSFVPFDSEITEQEPHRERHTGAYTALPPVIGPL